MVRQRIPEYKLGSSGWAVDGGTSAAKPKPSKVKRRIQTRGTVTVAILLTR
jgi:hypothetical protein